jgi:hypothetical protein
MGTLVFGLPVYTHKDGNVADALDRGASVAAALTARGHEVAPIVRGNDRGLYGRGQIILRNRESGVLWAGSVSSQHTGSFA